MKSFLLSPLMLVPVCTLGMRVPLSNPLASPLSAQERIALTANCDNSLLNLRAGAALDVTRLSAGEHTVLAQAQQAAPDLASMRAGDMSDHDWLVVGVVVLAVLLVVAIT